MTQLVDQRVYITGEKVSESPTWSGLSLKGEGGACSLISKVPQELTARGLAVLHFHFPVS